MTPRGAVVVSGAASGMGRAAVEALLADGERVVGVDRSAAPAELDGDERVDWCHGGPTTAYDLEGLARP